MSGINMNGRTIHLPAKTSNGINISDALGQLNTGAQPTDRDLIAALAAAELIRRNGCSTVDPVRPEAINLVDLINDLVDPAVQATSCGPCATTTAAKPNAVAVLYGAMLDYYQRAAADLPEVEAETDDTATTLAAIQATLASLESGQTAIQNDIVSMQSRLTILEAG